MILDKIIRHLQRVKKKFKMESLKDIVTTSDTTYVSADNSFFIGKTEKYLFIYKKKDSSTDIIPS